MTRPWLMFARISNKTTLCQLSGKFIEFGLKLRLLRLEEPCCRGYNNEPVVKVREPCLKKNKQQHWLSVGNEKFSFVSPMSDIVLLRLSTPNSCRHTYQHHTSSFGCIIITSAKAVKFSLLFVRLSVRITPIARRRHNKLTSASQT